MRFLLILTVIAGLLLSTVSAIADQVEDEAAVRKAEEEYTAAINAHDAKAVAATYVENAENL